MQINRRSFMLSATTAIAAATFGTAAFAQKPPVYTEDGIAIDGTDTVSYFTMGKPVAGSMDHALDWNGSKWLFSSAENLETFKANPTAYAPQYGGYCAFAMSKGAVAPTVPEAWAIVDGKLYLNFSLDVQVMWKEDIPGNIKLADEHWPKALENT